MTAIISTQEPDWDMELEARIVMSRSYREDPGEDMGPKDPKDILAECYDVPGRVLDYLSDDDAAMALEALEEDDDREELRSLTGADEAAVAALYGTELRAAVDRARSGRYRRGTLPF